MLRRSDHVDDTHLCRIDQHYLVLNHRVLVQRRRQVADHGQLRKRVRRGVTGAALLQLFRGVKNIDVDADVACGAGGAAGAGVDVVTSLSPTFGAPVVKKLEAYRTWKVPSVDTGFWATATAENSTAAAE